MADATTGNKSEIEKHIDTARATENLEREAALRFGPRVKVTFDPEFPRDELVVVDTDNYRFAAGMNIGGFTLQDDHRNLDGIADEIEALRGITTPLVASRRADKTVHLKQGYRRFHGSNLVRQRQPGSPLAERLANLPVIIYDGLTLDQESQLVNDQKSKLFSLSEVFVLFVREYKGGFHWLNICERMYNQIGVVTGNAEMIRKVDQITDKAEKSKQIRDWLLSFVYQGWVNGIKSGPIVENLWLQTYLWKDGFKGVPRPRVIMDSNRMKKIWSAVSADMNANEFANGKGPRSDKELDKFAAEDSKKYNEDGSKKKIVRDETRFTLRPAKEVEELIKNEMVDDKPSLLSRVYSVTAKDGGDPEATRLVRNFDRCREVFNQHRAYLNVASQSVLSLILDGIEGSHEKFAEFLAANYVDQPEKPEIPTDTLAESVEEVIAPVAVPAPVVEATETPTVVSPAVEAIPEEAYTEPAEANEDGSFSLGENTGTGNKQRKGKNKVHK